MDLDFDPYLRVGDVTVGARDVALLRAVGREGSLNGAASALGRSYSRAHARLSDLEDALGTLVERRRGGADGGGSELTPAARELLERFADLADALSGTAGTPHATLTGTVVEREGELATVETPAGTVRAVLADERAVAADDGATAADDTDRVRVRFPADAVTLHAPDGTPAETETSARNRFAGTVAAIEAEEATASVTVDVGASAPLAVRVTLASVELLDLAPGRAVVATVKATATRARGTTSHDE